MADFNEAHRKTQIIEGGYVNNRSDRGGETYKGIARKYHSGWEGWDIIDKIKQIKVIRRNEIVKDKILDKMVDDFYKLNFWDANNLDNIENQNIAEELFDTGVNMGTMVAAKFLQISLNLFNRDERDFKNLIVDGFIGKNTLKVVNSLPYQAAIFKALNGLQFMRYIDICESDESQEVFFRGWLKRI